MIRSMTGFGERQGLWGDSTVIVEVRSVNHRFLETAIRLPKSMNSLEDSLKKAIHAYCTRGRVELNVHFRGGSRGIRSLELDATLAKQYHRALRTLQQTLKLEGAIDIGLVAGLRDIVLLSDHPAGDPKLARLVTSLCRQALHDLVRMRKREGTLLARDIVGRISTLRALKGLVTERAPALEQESFARMKDRVEKLLGGDVPDLPRLHQELAHYADRCDITEELVRLDAHMVQFKQSIRSAQSVGKTLEFLLQEMGREVNTIGSKANDVTLTAVVVKMKAELERIREQVQNVE